MEKGTERDIWLGSSPSLLVGGRLHVRTCSVHNISDQLQQTLRLAQHAHQLPVAADFRHKIVTQNDQIRL